ncbi:MAG: class I SAM-dependent methyltransferase [Deltaproteobacteria bacterium]|nr:class I SAM-dependent methyltransferase [Deltaproteobacteria bacterium]
MALKRDFLLKLFLDTVKSDMLHLGYSAPGQPLAWADLPAAQLAYEDRMVGLIPEATSSILEVGCGTGHTTARLQRQGLPVQCLSPDILQKEIIEKKFGRSIVFHNTTFEDLDVDGRYQLILMLESFGYIALERCLEQCRRYLTADGRVLIADIFRQDRNREYKSFHVWDDVVAATRSHGFECRLVEDITGNIVPTLDLAASVYAQFVVPIVDTLYGAAMHSIDKKKLKKLPLKLARALFQKKIDALLADAHQRVPTILSGDYFAQHARYLIVELRPVAEGRPAA